MRGKNSSCQVSFSLHPIRGLWILGVMPVWLKVVVAIATGVLVGVQRARAAGAASRSTEEATKAAEETARAEAERAGKAAQRAEERRRAEEERRRAEEERRMVEEERKAERTGEAPEELNRTRAPRRQRRLAVNTTTSTFGARVLLSSSRVDNPGPEN